MGRYLLNPQYRLNEWIGPEYAIEDIKQKTLTFLGLADYNVLRLCDGKTDLSQSFYPTDYERAAAVFEENGIIQLCHDKNETDLCDTITEDINTPVHFYNCCYISQAQWSITGNCNYRCRHCYMSAPHNKYGEMSFEKCKDIIRQIADCGIRKIALTGGEPLVRKDFFELVDLLFEENIEVYQLYTNGALVDERLLKYFIDKGIRPEFSISFDGKGWHDWMRGVPGAEENAVRAFKLLKEYEFPCSVEMCVHKNNIETIRSTVRYLAELGVRSIKITPASASGLWCEMGGEYDLSFKELFEAYLSYIPEYYEDGAPLNLMLGGFFSCEKGGTNYSIPGLKFTGEEDSLMLPVCSSARTNMYIAADGKVLPCIPLTGLSEQEQYHSLKDISLSEILSDSFYLSRVQTTLLELLEQNEECRVCEYKYHCGGGCRAGALIAKNSYYGKDESTCYMFRHGYVEKINEVIKSITNY